MKNQWETLQAHPATVIVPMLEGASFDALKEDIRANGQQIPIVLLSGLIIDGRSRMRACLELGIAPKTTQLEVVPGGSPTMYVLSTNLHRRHLSPSQLAMVAARARDEFGREGRFRQAGVPQLSGDARDLAGRIAGVSGKTVDYASHVLKHGVPEIVAACDAGKLAVSKAARLIQLQAQHSPSEPTPTPSPTLREVPNVNARIVQFERATTVTAFDQLVTKARDLETFVRQRCGSVGPLIDQGQFDLAVILAGVQRVEDVASLLLGWVKQARRELRPTRQARRAGPTAAE